MLNSHNTKPAHLALTFDPVTQTAHINLMIDIQEMRRLLALAEEHGQQTISWNLPEQKTEFMFEIVDPKLCPLSKTGYYHSVSPEAGREINYVGLL